MARPLLHPRLVNRPFGDPGLYVELMFERRALLFDLGDLGSLSARKLLHVSDVFVSHAHMDHFCGFDRMLRLLLGRDQRLRLFGPAGFIDRVESKLGAYSWNLVGSFESDFTLLVGEVREEGRLVTASFRCRDAFARRALGETALAEGVLLEEPGFRVRAAVLDHGIPCLAFAVEETFHVNVWKNRVEAMGLAVGPWLRELKHAVQEGRPEDAPFRARWREAGEAKELTLPLGEFKSRLLRIVPGQKVAYVTDAAYTEENARRIVELARGADILFIETPFLEHHAEIAARKRHLTARQGGELARRAQVKRMVPFHFSPRYSGAAQALRQEARRAFRG